MHHSIQKYGAEKWHRLAVVVIALLLAAPSIADNKDAAALDQKREAAVERARQGDATGALRDLVALRTRSPNDVPLQIDTGVIAAWAGEDTVALEHLGSLPMAELPNYAISTLAKSARNVGNWDVAVAGYDTLIDQDPDELDHRLGKIMTLADADRIAAARKTMQAASSHFGNMAAASVALGLACGYIEESAYRLTHALGCYDKVLALDPDNRAAQRQRIYVASGLGAAEVALNQARAKPGLLQEDDLLRLEIDAIAMGIRWADMPDGTRIGKRDAKYLSQMAELANKNPHLLNDLADRNGRAFQFDRVSALATGYSMKEAIELFESLEAQPILMGKIPGYVYAAAGRAYLFDEQPEKAERTFRIAIALSPNWFTPQVGLFYALSDQRRSAEARDVASKMLAAEPAWVRPTRRVWLENDKFAQARQITAMDYAYQEKYATALHSLDEMLAIAPANANTRVARAQVLSWRGWLNQAEEELALARLADPNNVGTALVGGHVALDSQRYRDAESSLQKVVLASPLEKSTLRLEERWDVHNSTEFSIQANAGRSEGSAFSSDSWNTEAYYFSKPKAYNYRAYVHDVSRYADLIEGKTHDHRIGVGIEYRGHYFTARGEVNQGLEVNEDIGASVTLDWHLTDRIILSSGANINSVDMPLRGLRVGTSGDTYTTAGTYRWHEGMDFTARASFGDYEDNNDRRGYSATYRWRVLNTLKHKLITNVSGFVSSNSEIDKPYYNPSNDQTYTASLTHEWQVYRRYQRGMLQRFAVEVGDYWQEGVGSGSIWTLRLDHEWSLGPRWQLSYGLSTGGRLYDGDREHATTLFLGLQGRM